MRKRARKDSTSGGGSVAPDLSPLLERLSMISMSLGVLAVRFAPSKPKKLGQKVTLLRHLGFTPKESAAILGSTPGSVSVRLSEGRSRRKGARRGKN